MSTSGTGRAQMGPQQNIALVQQVYAAFGRRDIPAIVNELAEDVDWQGVVGVGSNVPTGGARHGRDAVSQFFGQVADNIDFLRFEPREFLAEGDKVVTLGVYEAIAKPTGRRFASDWVMVFTIKDGKITQFREYADAGAITGAF